MKGGVLGKKENREHTIFWWIRRLEMMKIGLFKGEKRKNREDSLIF